MIKHDDEAFNEACGKHFRNGMTAAELMAFGAGWDYQQNRIAELEDRLKEAEKALEDISGMYGDEYTSEQCAEKAEAFLNAQEDK